MRRAIPSVKGERLYQSETDRDPIVVGTPAWYDWLEQHTAFTFVDRTVTFTARKSILAPRVPTGKRTARVEASSTASTWDTRLR